MVVDSITEAILIGIAPLPRNSPKRVTIEYNPGQTLVLEGDSLGMWWSEYLKMYYIVQQAQIANQQAQKMAEEIDNTPAVASESIRDVFKAQQEKLEKKE